MHTENPLAFPRNPYNRLVKHYRDGRLLGGGINDPELDARITLELLNEQIEALRVLDARSPNLTTAFHALTAAEESGAGFDAVFRAVRNQRRPDSPLLHSATADLLSGVDCRTHAAVLCGGPRPMPGLSPMRFHGFWSPAMTPSCRLG